MQCRACCTRLDSALKLLCDASPGAGGGNQDRGCAHWCCFPSAGHRDKNVPQQSHSSEPLHAGSLLTNNCRYKKCRDAVKPHRSRVSASSEAAGRISPIPSSLLPSRSALLRRGEHDLTPEEFPLWETLENALVPCDHLLEQSLPPAGCQMGLEHPKAPRGEHISGSHCQHRHPCFTHKM